MRLGFLLLSSMFIANAATAKTDKPEKRTPFSVISQTARERGLTLVVLNISADSELQKEINADNGFQSRGDLMLWYGWIAAETNEASLWTRGFTVRITDYGRLRSPTDILTDVETLEELKSLLRPVSDMTEKKLSFDTGKKDKHGKAIRREFPVMFSIADRAKKHREKKAVKK